MKWGNGNFVIRTHSELLLEDFIAVLIDAPSDHQTNRGMLGGFRNSTEHADDIAAVIGFLKKSYNVPVWLHGTSRGSESVSNAASRNIPGISGIILSSSISKTNNSGGSILERPLDKITVPALILAHKDDACDKTPPEDAKRIAQAMTALPARLMFSFLKAAANRNPVLAKREVSMDSWALNWTYWIPSPLLSKIIKAEPAGYDRRSSLDRRRSIDGPRPALSHGNLRKHNATPSCPMPFRIIEG